ncbi:ADP-ribosylglycohydrolase family protein [Streptomyces sp. DSM 40750]|uniref:ADP-ribosylglycohydrolase family protein n=1 Tax=Streptomyces sp. DSM 40750 TaxID=2801030 RepID=UPI00214B302E|nr:ADP-ribosylglycohydrolase family protein [Streptomyces sp. DSM 40750]UUU19279.1 ADP-ribosylglycohydrolase family protein [Streptomyces sp. DSM 40750]UUU27377.1 ADP-ribosylglycohydrolase family protein [Streptomyces sp. DSM 40750]
MISQQRAHASLDGLVMGDAFGDGWFTRSDENAEELWAARVLRPEPWSWTDDSAMAFVLFAHLMTHGEIRPDALAVEFAAEYDRDPGRKYGPSMHGVLRSIREGGHWRAVTTAQFGGQGSHGNGAAMRVAPLGAWFRDDLAAAGEQARLSALTTHAHPEAVAGAVAVAVAAALAAADGGPDAPPRAEFLKEVADHVPDSDVRSRLLVAANFSDRTSVRHAASVLGSGALISALDTVPFALWSAAGHLNDLGEALWQTAGAWGDRDTTCAIAGGVVAARTGTGGVPAAWLEAREDIPAWSRWEAPVVGPTGAE